MDKSHKKNESEIFLPFEADIHPFNVLRMEKAV